MHTLLLTLLTYAGVGGGLHCVPRRRAALLLLYCYVLLIYCCVLQAWEVDFTAFRAGEQLVNVVPGIESLTHKAT